MSEKAHHVLLALNMKYKIETHFGCTANSIIVNDKSLYGEDPRYSLSDEESKVFIDDLFKLARQDLDQGCITLTQIIELFQCDNVEYSDTCDQCGDTVCSTYYELELDSNKN